MGEIHQPRRVLQLAAVFSRHPSALDWARERMIEQWGPLSLSSERFAFDQTRYYGKEMGGDLLKELHVVSKLADPSDLPDWKRLTNQWEQELAKPGQYEELRPLNVDPGYLTEAKLVLATTKDRDHRIYLCQGIFAEVTLYYHRGSWQTRPWTYPDYAEARCHQFLDQCRERLRLDLRST